jgi:hypothetical protein
LGKCALWWLEPCPILLIPLSGIASKGETVPLNLEGKVRSLDYGLRKELWDWNRDHGTKISPQIKVS